MDFNLMLDQMAEATATAASNTEAAMNSGDLSNPEVWLKVQGALGQYTNLIGAESAMIKKFDDMMAGIVAKI
jgi:type III secretion apparatus needle protein